jgi:tetratricopeptide (TPR) repeat protein
MLRDTTFEHGDLPRAAELLADGLDEAERHGNQAAGRWLRGERSFELYHGGDWDRALAALDEVLGTASEPWWFDPALLCVRAHVNVARGEGEAAVADAERALAQGREARDPQVLYPAIAISAFVFDRLGDSARAAAHADEVLALWQERPKRNPRSSWLVELGCVLLSLGRADELAAALRHVPTLTMWGEATLALVSGAPQEASEHFVRIGSRPSEALARMFAGEALVTEGRRSEADAQLRAAAAFWRSVGAKRYLSDTEALLAAAS